MSAQRWEQVEIDETFTSEPRNWLAARMSEGMAWLLAHADDGVIWGRMQPDGALILSSDVAELPPKYPAIAVGLRAKTLQQARIFGPAGELLVWRAGNGFRGRCIMDGGDAPADAWQEQHLLWGMRAMAAADFTVLQEGQQGPVHAVPLSVPGGKRAALTVRHYVDSGDQNQAVVSVSRLVRLGLHETQGGG
jgi:CRISPR-associated protein (TIGR03984 family)